LHEHRVFKKLTYEDIFAMKLYTKAEVAELLKEQKRELIDGFKSSLDEVKDCYPISIFPEDSKSRDCMNARVARKTVDQVWKVFSEKEKVQVHEVEIVPVTMYEGGLIWGKYKGWKGRIVRESMNGRHKAFEVMISGDGVSFIRAIINKEDCK